MMPIWFIKHWQTGLAIIGLIGGFLGGWTVRDWRADSDALKALQTASIERDRLTTKMGGLAFEYEQSRNAMGTARHDTTTKIREFYRDVPVNVDCAVPDPVRGLLETARNRANSTTASESGK